MRFFITVGRQFGLLEEPLPLVVRVVDLGEGVGDFLGRDVALEAPDQAWIIRALLRQRRGLEREFGDEGDRKSTRLNSSHTVISYAVFCLKKKKKKEREII